MWLDDETEKLFVKYFDPKSIFTPAEAHKLAQRLLESYRRSVKNSESLHVKLKELLDRYSGKIEKINKSTKIKESEDIFKWWKEFIGIPSIQGILYTETGVTPASVFKLFVVTCFSVKQYWTKREARKLMVALERELRNGGTIKTFSEKLMDYQEKANREEVWSSSPEVDELAEKLLEIRKNIYGG